MNKQNVLFAVIGLIAGFAIGFFLANNINRNASLQPIAQSNPNTSSLNVQNNAQVFDGTTKGPMLPEITQTLEKAQREPDNFKAQIQAGEIYLKIQDSTKASEFFTKAASIARQDNFQELATLGNAFFDIKNYEEAEKWYSLALAQKPDDIDVRTDLGSTFMERSQPDLERAIKEYQTSLSKNPKHESTIFNLSLALFRKGDSQGARAMLDELKKVNPQSTLIARLEQRISEKSVTN